MVWPIFTNPAFWAAASTALGLGASKVQADASKKEQERLALAQQRRANEESMARSRQQNAEFAAQMRADSIMDQQYKLENQERGDFANRIQNFDLIEKSKGLKEKQGERIASQERTIAQATADGKLRAGSDVQGRISGAFDEAVAEKSGQIQERAANIGQLMGRLSGAKADYMREGDIIRDMQSDRNVLAGRVRGYQADADREIRSGQAEGNVAGWIREAPYFKFDDSSSLANWLKIGSLASGLYGMGSGLVSGSQNLAGNGMSAAGNQIGSGAESTAAFNAGDVGFAGLPIGSSAGAQASALRGIQNNPINWFGGATRWNPSGSDPLKLAPMRY